MAYTPGLKRKKLVLIRKARRLPLKGKVLVEKREVLSPDTIVARTELPGEPVVVNLALLLGIDPQDQADSIENYMYKRMSDEVREGDAIAGYSQLFGLLKKRIPSPATGTIELISPLSGQVIIRGSPVPVEVSAYIPGIVSDVVKDEGAIIDCAGAFIQGIFGIGGETHGEISVMPDILRENDVTTSSSGKILVAKLTPEVEAVKKAVSVGVKGIICGGIKEKLLSEFMGYEIGVAITGHENVGLTLIITEGFGNMEMSEKTFGLLKEFEGRMACINGATQIRAGVLRPEIIIPQEVEMRQLSMYDVEDTDVLSLGLQVGTPVRIIRGTYFGKLGRVVALPPELKIVDTGSRVRVLEAELEDGRRVMIPRANVEIIGE